MSFNILREKIQKQFEAMTKSGPLFTVQYDRDAIWNAYISAFPSEFVKENTCNCCRAFIRQIGACVSVGPDNRLVTIWDIDGIDDEYAAPIASLREYVLSQPIVGLYHNSEKHVGTDKTPDPKNAVIWSHFYVRLPRNLDQPPAGITETVGVLKRGVEDITDDAIDTVLELISQNSIYRGADYNHMIVEFKKIKASAKGVETELRNNFYYKTAKNSSEAVCRIRNCAIGNLLIDLSENRDLDEALKSFERIVAPANYKRPTAVVTPKMIAAAKKRLSELDLLSALERRRLDYRDLKAASAIFVHRPKASVTDVFAEMAGEAPVDIKTLSKVESISIVDFIEKILPAANSVKVLFERTHLGNLVTMTGAVDENAKPLFKWDNSFAWSYTGGVADSIKEKVKNAGGRVEGVWFRASLAWYNYDDLDLHFGSDRGHRVNFCNKYDPRLDVRLDVDMNAGSGHTRSAVENIYANKVLPAGKYSIIVNNYMKRETIDSGFEIEIEVNGETYNFSSARSPATGQSISLSFKVDSAGNVLFEDNSLSKTSTGTVKWGLKTGIWHLVKAITLSPNHWTRPIGNKHWFFLLQGALSDEKTRPFYNEFLCDALTKERKVMEILADKIQVASADGAELSGLGFSETLRNHVYVEVEGKVKRILKVNF